MTESKNWRNLIRYYCTVGKGLELFLIEELKKNLAAEDVSVRKFFLIIKKDKRFSGSGCWSSLNFIKDYLNVTH